MSSRGLALGAGDNFQGETRRVDVELRMQLQQRLVDTAQLLGVQVAVVHRPAHAVVDGEGQRADRVQQVAVGQVGGVQVGRGAT